MKKHYIFLLITGLFTFSAFSQSPDILLNGTVSAENNQIKNVADPTDPADVVNKYYLLQVLDTTNIYGNLQNVLNAGPNANLILDSNNNQGVELIFSVDGDNHMIYKGFTSTIDVANGQAYAIFADASAPNQDRNHAIQGSASGGEELNVGLVGLSSGSGEETTNMGVWGQARYSPGSNIGVTGYAHFESGQNYGIYGSAMNSSNLNIGVAAETSANISHNGDNYALRASAMSESESGVNYGVYSIASGGSESYSGYFVGDLKVTEGKIDSDVTLVNPPTEDMDAVNKSYLLEILESYQVQIDNLQNQIDELELQLNNNATVPSEGLVAYFPFNGNANDISGNNNNGTVSGASLALDRNGTPDKAYEFSVNPNGGWGSPQQEILVDYASSMNSNTISLSAWIFLREKTGNFANRPSTIFGRWADGVANEVFRFQITGDSNEIFLQLSNASSSGNTENDSAFISGGSIEFDTWTHVAITYDGSVGKVYQNGVLVTEEQVDADVNFGGSALNIGSLKSSNGTWYLFDGKLDELGYWRRVLSANEISALYNQ